jgi:hypothetical protein
MPRLAICLLALIPLGFWGEGKVPHNGERNEQSGVYKSLCCGAKIVINPGTTFPDCPNHQKLTTTWKAVSDGKVQPSSANKEGAVPDGILQAIAANKAEADPAVIHVENRRLFQCASGAIRLEDWEHSHLLDCKVCKGVLYVFVHQSVNPAGDMPKSAEAA